MSNSKVVGLTALIVLFVGLVIVGPEGGIFDALKVGFAILIGIVILGLFTEPTLSSENINHDNYENFCADIFNQKGWDTTFTQPLGKKGADMIARKYGSTAAVKFVKHNQQVSAEAIEGVNAARHFYDANLAFMVSDNKYTDSAKKLANKLDVLLLHHDDIDDLY